MTKKEELEINEERFAVYSGILFHNQRFAAGNRERIRYDFSCPQFARLRQQYNLEAIAGKGSDFQRARRLLHYLAPRLTHSSWYDNHIPCNALDLLEYSLNKPEQGINCLNKSKILEECCLALGIFARRVSIMPYSPYDLDNHVVTEIYDRKREKWIMLDPTTDGYFADEAGTPLSLLEIRERFAGGGFATFLLSTNKPVNLVARKEKYMDINAYICKNLFYFLVDQDCRFGPAENQLVFCPEHFSIQEQNIAKMNYSLRTIPAEHADWADRCRNMLEALTRSEEPPRTDLQILRMAPTD